MMANRYYQRAIRAMKLIVFVHLPFGSSLKLPGNL
jgi:hypothetical protein